MKECYLKKDLEDTDYKEDSSLYFR
jgi:hypothetical protein